MRVLVEGWKADETPVLWKKSPTAKLHSQELWRHNSGNHGTDGGDSDAGEEGGKDSSPCPERTTE